MSFKRVICICAFIMGGSLISLILGGEAGFGIFCNLIGFSIVICIIIAMLGWK